MVKWCVWVYEHIFDCCVDPLEVEADTEEEATEKARDLGYYVDYVEPWYSDQV